MIGFAILKIIKRVVWREDWKMTKGAREVS